MILLLAEVKLMERGNLFSVFQMDHHHHHRDHLSQKSINIPQPKRHPSINRPPIEWRLPPVLSYDGSPTPPPPPLYQTYLICKYCSTPRFVLLPIFAHHHLNWNRVGHLCSFTDTIIGRPTCPRTRTVRCASKDGGVNTSEQPLYLSTKLQWM